jgi:hypothetical protein
MKTYLIAAGLMLVLVLSASAPAQYYGRYYGNQHAAATPIGDYLLGRGEVIRSAGEAARNRAEAAIYFETARAKFQQNKYDAAKTFWNRRMLWQQKMAELRGRPLTGEQLREFGRYFAPKRLSAFELSPSTGEIRWPSVLQSPEYRRERAQLETIFERRTGSSPVGELEHAAVVAELTSAMQRRLEASIKSLSANQYIEAKNFIRGLALEGETIDRAEDVAQR